MALESIHIDKSVGIPIYIQLKEQLKHLILFKYLKEGDPLPSGRVLAANLHITRGTVLKAYQELEMEGFITSQHGRGVFVRGVPQAFPGPGNQQVISNLIDTLLITARLHNVSLEAVVSLIYKKYNEHPSSKLLPAEKIVFLECHHQPLLDYKQRLQESLGVDVEAYLLKDVLNDQKVKDQLGQANTIVVTTFFHLREVQAALPKAFVFAINVVPHIHTLKHLSDLPAGARIGVVCRPEKTAEEMVLSFKKSGVQNLVGHASPDKPEEVFALASKCTHLVVTSECAGTIDRLPTPVPEVIWFENSLDQASIHLLQTIIGNGK